MIDIATIITLVGPVVALVVLDVVVRQVWRLRRLSGQASSKPVQKPTTHVAAPKRRAVEPPAHKRDRRVA